MTDKELLQFYKAWCFQLHRIRTGEKFDWDGPELETCEWCNTLVQWPHKCRSSNAIAHEEYMMYGSGD